MKSLIAIIGMTLFFPLSVLLMLITLRMFMETRFLPSANMSPSLKVDDRVLLEKVSTMLRRPYVRGEIIVFYPPPIEMDGKDLSWDFLHVMGRLTGLQFLPSEPAFLKRVIGLPGDTIRIVGGQGVFLNGKKLNETSYIKEPAQYSLTNLQDIGSRRIDGTAIEPYKNSSDLKVPITVPPGQLFVLGDNRNNSEDSHVFGMVSNSRVIGCVMMKFYPELKIIHRPTYNAE